MTEEVSIGREKGRLRCPRCHSTLDVERGSGARCRTGGHGFEERHHVLDLLGEPVGAVSTELRGLAEENAVDFAAEGPNAIKFLEVPHIETASELMDLSRGQGVQYYQQTHSAYLEALARARLDAHLVAAEVGAERTLWNLRVIEDLCDDLFAINIFFHCSEAVPRDGITRVLADMNDLPFESGSLDLVIYSATLHHSSNLRMAFSEAARVLRPGGRAIVVNEPIAGAAKRLGGRMTHDRHECIHEDDVTSGAWRSAIRASGLHADHFVPAWFVDQLRNVHDLPADTRFRGLGTRASVIARRPALADVARALLRAPGQALLGVPLNAVLWK